MNNQKKADLLEQVLEYAIKRRPEICHSAGLCAITNSMYDRGIINSNEHATVRFIINQVLRNAVQGLEELESLPTYLSQALNRKYGPLRSIELRGLWEQTYRDKITELRETYVPMFRGAEVGDRVFTVRHGWATVTGVDKHCPEGLVFRCEPDYDGSYFWFSYTGKENEDDLFPSVFWDKPQFEIPKNLKLKLPNLAIDTKVLVRTSENESWKKRYFHSFGEEGQMRTWIGGTTQYSADSPDYFMDWDYWKLDEEH